MATASPSRLTARPDPALPVEALLIGRDPEAAARLVGDVLALCGGAQMDAARRAFGLPRDAAVEAARRAEIRRDHLARLLVLWPARLGLAPLAAPSALASPPAARRALFGASGACPVGGRAMLDFLRSDHGVAPLLAAIGDRFAPGEGVVDLPLVDETTAFDPVAPVENTVAARRAADPALEAVEAKLGRGPVWRATARLVDLAGEMDGADPGQAPRPEGRAALDRPGMALVETARGLYAVRARVEDGRVAAFARVTPTDHLCAPGGLMDRALASLHDDARAKARLLIDILDPCCAVALEGPDPEEDA